jgi:ATP/maltotriose-dependent transcriptional regulator MalT
MSVSDHLAVGADALDRGDWQAASEAFGASLLQTETAEALDGLGQARWWMNDLDRAIELRSSAYAMFVDTDRPAPAVRIAAWLAREYFTVHGNMPAAGGWISRAESLLTKAGPCPEAGWLALIQSALAGDTDVMKRLADQAIDLGRSFGDKDLELVGLSAKGLACVYAAEVAQGMGHLDEAMAAAMGGELRSFGAFSDVYCNTLLACDRAGDFERAEQWCRIVMEMAQRKDAKPLFPFCHVTYGAILTATGRWAEAEEELDLALRLFSVGHRGMRVIALSRLADLRIRQGRVEEAALLLEGYEEHPLAIRAASRLHLAGGRPSLASGLLRRRLEFVGVHSALAAPLLSMLVEAQLAIGNTSSATDSAHHLAELARTTGQRSVIADSELALGAASLAAGDPDALLHLDRAAELYAALEQPLEAGRARALAARARNADEHDLAVADVRSAMATFEGLGARRDFDAAAEQLRSMGVAAAPGPRGFGSLTRREDEVLRLMAAGLSNGELADRLFISSRTVEHHVSNVLHKLGLRTRAEAAAYVAREQAPK